MKMRLIGIDAARGAAVILVVFMHVSAATSAGAKSLHTLLVDPLFALNWMAGSVRMPLLMFISGTFTKSDDEQSRLRSRALSFLWLFTIWTFLDLLIDKRLGELPAELVHPTTPLWYLWALAIINFILPYLRRLQPAAVIMALGLIAMLAETQLADSAMRNAARYLVFFFVGLYWGGQVIAHLRERPWRSAGVCGSVLMATHWLDAAAISAGILRPGILAERLVASLLVLIAFLNAPAPALAGLAWIGRRTIAILLAHMPLLSLLHASEDQLHVTIGSVQTVSLIVPLALLLNGLAPFARLSALYAYPADAISSLWAISPRPARWSRSLM